MPSQENSGLFDPCSRRVLVLLKWPDADIKSEAVALKQSGRLRKRHFNGCLIFLMSLFVLI